MTIFKESVRDIKRHKRASILLALLISLAAFLFFVFSSVVYNLGSIEDKWSKQIKISVFALDNTDPVKLSENIKNTKGVLEVTTISPEQALEILKKRFPQEEVAFASSSVPGFIEARVSINDAETVKAQILKIDGVDDVSVSSSWFKSLKDLIYFSGLFSVGVMIFILGLSVFLVFYAVRIGFLERKEEIQLMRLCGATEWRIRSPYVVSGVLMGVLGASVGVFLYYAFGSAVDRVLSQFVDGWSSLTSFQILLVYTASVFIGSFGNLMALVRSADED